MSNKKNKKTEAGKAPSGSKHVQFPEFEVRKERRSTKILHPFQQTHSNDSFTSATSDFPINEDDHKGDLIVDQEVNISVLNKYIKGPVREVLPRPLIIESCHKDAKETKNVSAKQILENLRSLPAYNDVNLKLIHATLLGKLRAVKDAIRKGADVNLVVQTETPLMIATESGDTRLVSYFLKVPEIYINAQNILGQTPLIVAVGNGFDPIVKLLLKHNADVNLPDNFGRTPLHCALFQQRINLVKLLLAFGADCEKSDSFGERPMYTAAVKKPNLECLQALLKMGAVPNYNTMSGVSLLSRTILNGTDFRIIKKLVKYGASVNAQDAVSKKSPLHFAALTDNIEVAQFLVDSGADITLKTTYNFTPLDEASVQNSLDVKNFLGEIMRRYNLVEHNSKPTKPQRLIKHENIWKEGFQNIH